MSWLIIELTPAMCAVACGCKCSVSLPHDVVGWSAMCDSGHLECQKRIPQTKPTAPRGGHAGHNNNSHMTTRTQPKLRNNIYPPQRYDCTKLKMIKHLYK